MKDTDFLDVVNILSGDNTLSQGVLMYFQGIGTVLARWTLSTANKTNGIFHSYVRGISGSLGMGKTYDLDCIHSVMINFTSISYIPFPQTHCK